MNYIKHKHNLGLQRIIGIVVCGFSIFLAGVELVYFLVVENMGVFSAFNQPSVFLVLIIGLLFILTTVIDLPISRLVQVIIIFFSAYFAALGAGSGNLTSLIFLILGYLLAMEYGFLSNLFHFKTFVIVSLYFVFLLYGLHTQGPESILILIHSIAGAVMVTILSYAVISSQMKKDSRRTKELELQVLEHTSDLHEALEQRDYVLREVYHRTSKYLQLVSDLIKMENDGVRDENSCMPAAHRGRIQSVALAHEYLYRSENAESINFKVYLERLLSILALDLNDRNIKLRASIDTHIITNLAGAFPMGLIVNELLHHSIYECCGEQQGGELLVEAHVENEHIVLLIENKRVGTPKSGRKEHAESARMQLVHKLIKELEAELGHDHDNGTWRISIPLEPDEHILAERPVFYYQPRTLA